MVPPGARAVELGGTVRRMARRQRALLTKPSTWDSADRRDRGRIPRSPDREILVCLSLPITGYSRLGDALPLSYLRPFPPLTSLLSGPS